jgi:hypothetical protein
MFSMTIVFGSSPVAWTLLFKTQEAFDSARTNYNCATLTSFDGKTFECLDDYGQHAIIARSSIHGVMFEDLEQSKLAGVERGLHQTRTQIMAEQAGRSDPAIASYMRTRQQGPAVMTPFNGAFRQ